MNYLFGQQKAPPPPPAPPAPPPVDPVEQQRKMEARAQELQGKIEKIDADLQGLKHQFQTPGSNKPIIKQRCAHLMQNRGELNKQLQMVQAGNFSLGRSAWRGGAGGGVAQCEQQREAAAYHHPSHTHTHSHLPTSPPPSLPVTAAIEQQETLQTTVSAMKGLVATAKAQQASSEWNIDSLAEVQDEVAEVLAQQQEVTDMFMMDSVGADGDTINADVDALLADYDGGGGGGGAMAAAGGAPAAAAPWQAAALPSTALPPMPTNWAVPQVGGGGGGGGGGARLPNMPLPGNR